MSDPMSTPEIEDVLSSIRRLVSEDLRPTGKIAEGAEAQPRPATPPNKPAAKLLLTPALRVVDDGPEDQPARAGADGANQAETMPKDQDEPAAEGAVQEVVARLGAAVDAQGDEWESPVGDPPAWEERALGEAEAASYSGRLHFHATVDDQQDSGPSFLHSDPRAFVEADGHDTAEEVEPATVDLEDQPAAPRRVVSPPMDDWADAAEAEVRAELERDVADETASMFAGAEATFDEEVLRDLVRDIIREELAGSLGERITRNVRKLVRAEIARALAVRDFE